MKSRIVLLLCFVLTLFATSLRAPTAEAGQTAPRCAYAWSHYSGWEPWGWIGDNIAQKWGTKYGVRFSVALINDYIESVNQYTAGAFDGVAVTNMDGLTIPGVGGVDTTVLIGR